MTTFRILAAGSQEWSNEALVTSNIAAIATQNGAGVNDIVVIHSKSSGNFDEIIRKYSIEYGFATEEHDDYEDMVNSGADVCLTFVLPSSENQDETDCMELAEQAGIPIVLVSPM